MTPVGFDVEQIVDDVVGGSCERKAAESQQRNTQTADGNGMRKQQW